LTPTSAYTVAVAGDRVTVEERLPLPQVRSLSLATRQLKLLEPMPQLEPTCRTVSRAPVSGLHVVMRREPRRGVPGASVMGTSALTVPSRAGPGAGQLAIKAPVQPLAGMLPVMEPESPMATAAGDGHCAEGDMLRVAVVEGVGDAVMEGVVPKDTEPVEVVVMVCVGEGTEQCTATARRLTRPGQGSPYPLLPE